MIPALVIGVFAYFGCLFASRIVSERAFRTLADEQKVTLMDAFSGMRAYSALPVILIAAVTFGLFFLFPRFILLSMIACFAMLLLYMLLINVMVWRRLNSLDLPADFRRQFLIARSIYYAGLFALLGSPAVGLLVPR